MTSISFAFSIGRTIYVHKIVSLHLICLIMHDNEICCVVCVSRHLCVIVCVCDLEALKRDLSLSYSLRACEEYTH